MIDYFTLLDEPRRPWLEETVLKQKFLDLSARLHPDRTHHLSEVDRRSTQDRYVELNAGYNCLREPRDRLRHLLELERGSLPREIQPTPPEMMDLFMEIGGVLREADALLGEKVRITSPLLKVQFLERTHETVEKLLALQQTIRNRREHVLSQVKQADLAWVAHSSPASGRTELLQRLEGFYRLFSYLDRWMGQTQERIVQLSF
jgi:hypothetical protein